MQLKSKKKTILPIILVAIVAIVLIVLVVSWIASAISDAQEQKEANDIEAISIAVSPKTEYNIGEKLETERVLVQVHTKDMNNTYTVDYTQVSFSGYDSRTAGEQIITVTYKGFTTTFTVTVKEYLVDPNETRIEICDMFLEYTLTRWNSRGPSAYGAYVKFIYPDGTTRGSYEETPLSNDNIYGYEEVDGPCQFDLTIVYFDKDGKEYSTTVTVTITN